jgi:hypothetical protein
MRLKQKHLIARALVAALVVATFVQFGSAPAFAASASGMKDTLDRVKVSATTVAHSVSMTLPSGGIPNTQTLTLTYASFTAFAGSPTATCGTGTATAAAGSGNVLTITGSGSGCAVSGGTLTVSGFTGTNPGSANSYLVTLAGSAGVTGSFSVAIVTDDQVSITAAIDPSITFNVGANMGCSGSYSGNGGTVALGSLTAGAVATSNGTTVNNICTRLTTNAGSGAVVTVKSANAGLKSTAAPSDTIASATATLTAGTNGYGLCAGSTSDSGKDTTTPAGASPAAASPFNSTCTNSAHAVGQLTTSMQNVWSVSSVSQNAYYNLYIKAAVSGTQPAHSDYADTLTFVATATF